MIKRPGSLLWKISITNGNSNAMGDSYLFGTMHSASLLAYSHLEQIRTLISKCSHYFAETNEEGLTTQNTVWNLPDEWKGVRHLLGNSRFEKIDRVLSKNYGFRLERMDSLPPLMIASIVSEAMMCNQNGKNNILDMELWQYAKNTGLTLDGIESAREQYEIYKKIPLSFQLKQLKKLLLNLSKSRKNLMTLGKAYEKNDLQAIFRLSKNSLGAIRRILLYDRNKVMVYKIVQILKSHETNFVAIGAAHLPGSKGIIRCLKKEGIKVESVPLK